MLSSPLTKTLDWSQPNEALPRVVAMQPSPSYSGSDYIGVKRAGASALIGVRQTPLAVGFLGLALLLGALVWVWRREGGARG